MHNLDHNIQIFSDNKWILAKSYQIDAYKKFLQNLMYSDIFIEDNLKIVLNQNGQTFIIEDNIHIPIVDFNDIKRFVCSKDFMHFEWINAELYESLAFVDFLYSDHQKQDYNINQINNIKYNQTDNIKYNQTDNIKYNQTDTIYTFIRNFDGAIYYEIKSKSKPNTRFRMSNNYIQRIGYETFYDLMRSNIINQKTKINNI